MSVTENSIDPESVVSLREINKDSLSSILRLDVAEDQKRYVANNAVSIAQAHFEEKAWFRAIYADGTPVGFVMLFDDPQEPVYFLWRLMIDARYQGNGFGRRAIDLLVNYVKQRPQASELKVSHVKGQGPEGFYRKLGFEHTGEVMEGELVMSLSL